MLTDVAASPVDAGVETGDVTVIIPVKNRADLLPRALDSVFSQRPAPRQVVVIDDGSTDGSGELAAAMGATVLRNDASIGCGPARNRGIELADTTWVAFVDSDDEWLPGHLAGLLAAADGVDLVSAPAWTSDGSWLGNVAGHDVRVDAPAMVAPGINLVVSATMVRRDRALEVGGFPDVAYAEDFALWLRLLDTGTGVLTADPTCLYYRHASQMSADAPVEEAAIDHLRGYAGRPWYSDRLLRFYATRLHWDRLRQAGRAGDRAGVRQGLAHFARHPDELRAVLAVIAGRRRLAAAIRTHTPPAPQSQSGDPTPPTGGDVSPQD